MSKFFTDTDCELWYTDVDKYDINVLEMPYTIDGEEKYYDMGRNTDFKAMFDRMRAGALPITSALNPTDYINYFEPVFAAGEDIFYVHFSDKLSGTFNYMNLALGELKEKYPDRKITLFNTKNISVGAGFQALEAAKLHHEGKSDEEILAFLTDLSPRVETEFVVDSLSHLKRGGRISATSAVIGGLLNIKPILKLQADGTIAKVNTVKGMKKAILTMVEGLAAKIDLTKDYPVYIIDADNEEMALFAEKEVKKFLGENIEIVRYPIGPVIGAHCGPGTVGFVYCSKDKK